MPKKKKLPAAVIDTWPEIFNDLSVDVVPIEYLHSVNVKFSDGKIWEIDVKKSLQKSNVNLETAMSRTYSHEYEEVQ